MKEQERVHKDICDAMPPRKTHTKWRVIVSCATLPEDFLVLPPVNHTLCFSTSEILYGKAVAE